MDSTESKLPSSSINQGAVTPSQALELQPQPPGSGAESSTLQAPGQVAALPSTAVMTAQPSCLPQASVTANAVVSSSGQTQLQQPTPEAVSAAAAATWQLMQQALWAGNSSSNSTATVASALVNSAGTGATPENNASLFPSAIPSATQPHQTLQSLNSLVVSGAHPAIPLHQTPQPPALLPATPPLFTVNPVSKSQPPASYSATGGVPVATAPLPNGTKVAHSFTIESHKRRADEGHLQSTSASHVSNDSTTANHASSKSRKLASQANATVNATSVDGEASFSLDNLVPPQPKSEEELAKMTPVERRRCERNLREQQRSYRISQQIKELRDVLNESNIPFKPNKFSILVSVTEYIKQLQSRAIMLDAEHHKLVTTISKSSEAEASSSGAESGVGSASRSPPFADRSSSCSEGSEREAAAGGHGNGFDHHQDLLMVRGIDYGSIFGRCPFALGVASLDGRVLACNEALERLLGCPRLQMIEQSLFLYIRNHQEVFEAMADLLRRSNLGSERGDISSESQGQLLFWCGRIMSQSAQKVGVTVSREPASVEPSSHLLSVCSPLAKLHFTITLTTTPECNPKYFSFSASPVAAS